MSRRDRYREREIWSSGNLAVEYDQDQEEHWALVVWRVDDNGVDYEDDIRRRGYTAEVFVEYLRSRHILSPVEMAGLIIALSNLGHLS